MGAMGVEGHGGRSGRSGWACTGESFDWVWRHRARGPWGHGARSRKKKGLAAGGAGGHALGPFKVISLIGSRGIGPGDHGAMGPGATKSGGWPSEHGDMNRHMEGFMGAMGRGPWRAGGAGERGEGRAGGVGGHALGLRHRAGDHGAMGPGATK